MITETIYIQPNITIETELVGTRKFYVYNYKGVDYRVFNSHPALKAFLNDGCANWCFECCAESDLDVFFKK